MRLFTHPLPQDLAHLVLDYTLGPDTDEHLAHFRMIEQLRSLNNGSCTPPIRLLRPWSKKDTGNGYGALKYFNSYCIPLKPQFSAYHGVYIHAIWPFFSIQANLTRYTRPQA